MKRRGFGVAEAQKDLREQMLPGMLLHKVEAPFPVNLPMDFIRVNRTLKQMKNAACVVFDHVHYLHVAKRAEVMRLTA